MEGTWIRVVKKWPGVRREEENFWNMCLAMCTVKKLKRPPTNFEQKKPPHCAPSQILAAIFYAHNDESILKWKRTKEEEKKAFL